MDSILIARSLTVTKCSWIATRGYLFIFLHCLRLYPACCEQLTNQQVLQVSSWPILKIIPYSLSLPIKTSPEFLFWFITDFYITDKMNFLNFSKLFVLFSSFLVLRRIGYVESSELAGVMSELDQDKLRENGMFRPCLILLIIYI